MTGFIITGGDNTTIYTWLTLVSWLSSIKFLRAFKSLRIFIQLLVESLKSSITFLVVLILLLVAFTASFIASNRDEPEDNFLEHLALCYRMMFGDFDTERLNANSWAVFLVSSTLMTIVMMNLLIAIISDTFTNVMENIEPSSYL